MFEAIENGSSSDVEALLESGANANAIAKDPKYLQHPLHFAIAENKLDIMLQLIKHGADTNLEADFEYEESVSPLLFALSPGKNNAVQLLLNNGADPNEHGCLAVAVRFTDVKWLRSCLSIS